jgi:hypothetical protein
VPQETTATARTRPPRARSIWRPYLRADCLIVRQELSRQRVGLASPDNSDTHDSNGGRSRRGRRGSGGGVTSYTSAADRKRRRLHSGGFGTRLETSRGGAGGGPGRRTSREPAAGVMDRRRSGQSSDSESRSLRTAGLGQPAGPRHSPAPTGLRRGTLDGHGWIGTKAVEITGFRVGRAVIQD